MSDKKKLVSIEDSRLAYMAGMLLKEVAAGLSQRNLTYETADGTVNITVPKDVNVEYNIEQKEKDGQTKTKLEIEISWKS
jgi:amphi-Trp domain-containing protein